ncbi:MAG: shikimate kinase [Candidatus Hydrogenedens sp.]|nr:shikimate kinase [Candidatus Hydrogenedens sp.]
MAGTAETACIVLTGMPGVGKSTLGVLLAKATARDFVDTDVVIQAREHRTLQQIAEAAGREGFRDIECEAICALDCPGAVVATGGSVIYRDAAMQHLRNIGVVVFLDLAIAPLLERLGDLDARGVSRTPGQTIEDLYLERKPLYRRYAHVTVDLTGMNHDEAEAAVRAAAEAYLEGAFQ